MKDSRRLWAWLLCLGILVALATSSAFLAHEAGHMCQGEDCEVCQGLALARTLVRGLGQCLGPALLLALALAGGRKGREGRQDIRPFFLTLVDLKVRLDD